MAVYDKAYELARELKGSDEYKEYQKAKAAVTSNEAALPILQDYRKTEIAIQTAVLGGKEPDSKLLEEMKRLREVVDMHGPITRFLEAERRILVMMADIQKILADALNLLEI